MTKLPLAAILAALLLLPAVAPAAPTNLLPDPSFAAGGALPEGWAPSAPGVIAREAGGRTGGHCLAVHPGSGDSSWAAPAPPISLLPGAIYRTSFWSRRAGGAGGAVVSGLSTVDRDFLPSADWQRHEFFFRAPADRSAFYRLGLWMATGAILFDNASLEPALAVPARVEGVPFPLGEGESLHGGHYVAAHALSGPGSNDHRCLESFTASFNSNRWCFADGSEVVYRYDFGRLRGEHPHVVFSANRCERGRLLVEVSLDGSAWRPVGEVSKTGEQEFALPISPPLFVRLRAGGPADIQVDQYRFACDLPALASVPPATGATRYLGLTTSDPALRIGLSEYHYRPAGENSLLATARSAGFQGPLQLRSSLERGGKTISQTEASGLVEAGGETRFELHYSPRQPGRQTLRLQALAGRRVVWEAEGSFFVSPLYEAGGGSLLADDAELAVWCCEPERKVSRGRPIPTTRGGALHLRAAGNEYEAAQLVLTPKAPLAHCRLQAGDLLGPSGARLPGSEIEIRQVAYVFTEQPTDVLGATDEWPDPLPLHDAPVDLPAHRNQPFWITVHVPAGLPAGDYRGALMLQAPGSSRAIPLVVHVWGFDLPRGTHVRSGFGLGADLIRRYHNLRTEDQSRRVFDLYLRDFASHRIAPYSFGRGIEVTWEKDARGLPLPKFDFSAFDEDAHYALDVLGFTGFRLDIQGLGGGTFYSREIGEIAGAKQGTREYDTAFTRYVQGIQQHLEAKGWLSKAYVYWFDEPDPKDNEFVRHGMEVLHRAAPKLTRLLTTHPQESLFGAVDLWCLPTSTFDGAAVKPRQAAGEEIWWYLCTGPKAPYFALFLDHYGTEMRLWLWETWKYGLDGILVWDTTYWTSRSAYPEPLQQDPWQDSMSWMSGYGLGAGEKTGWGNGDGRFLYPPAPDPAHGRAPRLEGPVPSIRWELLRRGMEDYEYFWLLRAEVKRLQAAGADPIRYRQAEQLLTVPADVCTSLTDFAATPESMDRHLEKLAREIEKLRR